MQIGFIDSVVLPLYVTLGQFLPKVNTQCVDMLEKNRKRWTNMAEEEQIKNDKTQGVIEQTAKLIPVIKAKAIPGIPKEAVKSHNERLDKRRQSIVQLGNNSAAFRVRMSSGFSDFDSESEMDFFHGEELSLAEKFIFFFHGKFVQGVLFTATVFALFGDDCRVAFFPNSADITIGAISLAVFIMFMLELIIRVYFEGKEYIKFYFWMDFVAAA